MTAIGSKYICIHAFVHLLRKHYNFLTLIQVQTFAWSRVSVAVDWVGVPSLLPNLQVRLKSQNKNSHNISSECDRDINILVKTTGLTTSSKFVIKASTLRFAVKLQVQRQYADCSNTAELLHRWRVRDHETICARAVGDSVQPLRRDVVYW